MSEPSDPVSPTTSHHSAPISVTTPPSSFPSKAPLVHHLPALKAELNQVATARGNVYAKKMGIIIRWDGDNTGAEEDAITMSRVMDTFNIQCTHHILKTSDPIPGWTLTDKIRKMILDCCNSKLNSLFVVYYAGHGTIVDGNLYFAMGEKLVSWSKIRADLNSYEDTDAMRRIDVLGVLDCCYSGAATRAQNSRTFQVIAACGPKEGTNPRIGQTISFTMRLFRAVHHFKGQASASMTTAALFREIQRQKPRGAPNAVMETLSGTRPITLVFKDRTISSRIPRLSTHVNEKHVLVKLTLHGPSQARGHSQALGHRYVLESFKNAIQDLPANMKVEISDAYETDQSIFLIIGMSWEAWALWSMVAHLEFIGIILGPSLMSRRLIEVPVANENSRPLYGKSGAE
ncbi:Peptidase C14, caspase catalytic [Penicillium camemberti]|uniref:Peptidase C14, caspase catalytic n=1 Tax=Penicillium camemberti (strain FM 013) TaxID=1429867 RepID=A0A0G4PJF0_PENC3|nr:Peptidase C14, caspase catalytic [Penicillium camemberti]